MYSANSTNSNVEKRAAVQQVENASKKGYDFSKSSMESITQKGFRFGPQDSQVAKVDQTLAHLFDTLSMECRLGAS